LQAPLHKNITVSYTKAVSSSIKKFFYLSQPDQEQIPKKNQNYFGDRWGECDGMLKAPKE
jgi:hypothetical protein